jgi:hypothetical protein
MLRSSETIYETLIWRGITCRISTTHDWKITGWSIITLRAPEEVPFPLGVRGYIRHGLERTELDARGGAVAFFRAWADREASSPAYLNAIARHKQGDLF